MAKDFYEVVRQFSGGKGELLLDGKWGLEREAQRITPEGDLAMTPHPAAFGNKLENPFITTDFSESQVELITPPFKTVEQVHGFLLQLQQNSEKALQNELLWPLSMPPRLPDEKDIPISVFDGSAEGRENEVYRKGLAIRYGKKMQMISGIHFNFSFGERLLEHLYRLYGKGTDRRSFIDDMYFSAARNFLRYRWLVIYLFGASPCMDPTFYSVIDEELEIVSRCCPECCSPVGGIEEYAASLRVSRFGYSDSVRGRNSVSYNGLKDYITGIRRLMATKSRAFTRLGLFRDGEQLQLNGNVLQKESEFYSPIRLKQRTGRGQSQLDALELNGVGYGEVRIIDLDPFEKTGISLQQMRFLQLFMLFCLLEKSEPISAPILERINGNHHLTALSGRKSKLQLYGYEGGRILLKEWSLSIFEKLMKLAQLADGAGTVGCSDTGAACGCGDKAGTGTACAAGIYAECIGKEYEKVLDPSLLPSARIRSEMAIRGESFLDFGIRKAMEHRYGKTDGRKAMEHRYGKTEAGRQFIGGLNMEDSKYTGLELSTRIVIKEALKRGIEVDILDSGDNFIRLRKNGRTEYIKQATRTSADTYISPLIMENKEVTKIVLRENGINVPGGVTVRSEEEALSVFEDFRRKDIVVKPKSTNFGKGVVILKQPYGVNDYLGAVKQALGCDDYVMVEEFIPGREFRFLVIGDEVAAILYRVPANVTGDGVHTIEELVGEKNKDPLRGKGYVTPLEKIRLGEVEREYLAFQGRDFSYVPRENETVYLRENSNISTGGDSIDYTDEIRDEYKQIAVNAAKAVGARICGADIIIRDIAEKPDGTNHSIIELNFNPALHIHDFPYRGKNRHVEEKILDLLGL